MDVTKPTFRYFEVCLGVGPNENPDTDLWVCIKALSTIMPSTEIITKFMKTDLDKRPWAKVLGFAMIDEATARQEYDFDNEPNWPILGM